MKKSLRLLRMAPYGSMTPIWRKYHNLDLYETTDVIPGFSEFHIRICPAGTFNGKFILNDNFYLSEICSNNSLFRIVRLFFRVVRVIKKYNINVVHSNDPFVYGFITLLAARFARRPYCVSLHADYDKREALGEAIIPVRFRKLYKFIQKRVFAHADLVISTQESWIDYLKRNGCPENKIRVVRYAIDMSPFTGPSGVDVREHFSLSQDDLIVSYVGRLEKGNYVDDIIKIAQEVIPKKDNLYFIICGKGTMYDKLHQYVLNNELEERIFLPGFIPNKLAISLRRQSDVNLVLMGGPSLIESCASGKPVISYDVEWHHELVKSGKTGFLIREHDIVAVADKIMQLLGDPDLGKELGKNAKKLAFERHDVERVYKDRKKVYLELLAMKEKS